MEAIFLPLAIGCAIAVALAVIVLGALVLMLPGCALAGLVRGLGMRRDPAKRMQWLAQAKHNPRRAAMLDWITARRAGDKAAQAAAMTRLKSL
ncbi:MAG: hypothetical protein ACREQX_05665 [Candidatus Binataceae bacterium]